MTKVDGKLYLAGVSTDHEIKLLMEKFSTAPSGTTITREEIAEICGVQVLGNRYRTIVARFKKTLLQQHNIEIKSVPGIGYAVLNAAERLNEGVNAVAGAFRHTRRAAERIRVIPDNELSQIDQNRKTHLQVVLSKVVDVVSDARKQIAPPKAFIAEASKNIVSQSSPATGGEH